MRGGKFAPATILFQQRAELRIELMSKPDSFWLETIGTAEPAAVDEYVDGVFKSLDECEVFRNATYTVHKRLVPADECGTEGGPSWPQMVHLSVKRNDRAVIHDWRDLQGIKNELVGPENEAVEVYPAESRLVDTANQFHIWAFVDPAVRLPFGFGQRIVSDKNPIAGSVQRPFEL